MRKGMPQMISQDAEPRPGLEAALRDVNIFWWRFMRQADTVPQTTRLEYS